MLFASILPATRSAALASTCALALAALPQSAIGQTVHDEQVWVNMTAMGTVSGDLVGFLEAQPRTGDGSSRLDQLLLRGALGWELAPGVTLYQGYAHVVVPVDGERDINEERSFQQLNLPLGKALGGEFTTRTRLEQRWRNDGKDTGWRLRGMLRYERPLRENSDAVNALVWAEGFVALNDTDWGARGGFDQLRSFVGAEVGLPGASTLEVGYLNQAVNQTAGRMRMNHVASVTLFWRP